MKFSRIRLSAKSQNQLGRLKARTELTPNLLARFALCLSLKEKSFPIPSQYDKDGNDIEPTVLFGEYESLYLGLMKNRHIIPLELDVIDLTLIKKLILQ